MKHCFVINPAAGNGKDHELLLRQIIETAKKLRVDYEIHRTSGPGEATIYARGRLEAGGGEAIRFYSCGGDGTAAEILNGIYGDPLAELAIVPIGSGNDYIRNFGEKKRFLDLNAQFAGEAVPVDIIEYSFTPVDRNDSDEVTLRALNMINMGFDAKVVRHMERMKNRIFLKGTGAYVAGVVRELAGYKMSHAIFHPEGEEDFETDILLAGVGSGRFSGGGFDGIPGAIVNDGMLDIMVIEPIKRGRFLRLVGKYHDGQHIEHPALIDYLRLYRVKKTVIEPGLPLIFTADGEVNYTVEPIKISIAPEKLRFVIPDGVKKP